MMKGLLWIIDIKLGKSRGKMGRRQKGTNPMGELSMKLEDPRAIAIIDPSV